VAVRILILPVWLVIAVQAQPKIVHGPVIDAITYSSARITWITDVPSSTFIRFGQSTSYDGETTGVKNVAVHSWYLSGLAAATTYHFQVCSQENGETCSEDHNFTTGEAPPVVPAEPEPPRQYVETSMPSGDYGDPFLVDSNCSNLPSILQAISELSGDLNYELLIPARTTCRGQFVFPNRPHHSGWIVVKAAGLDSGFPDEGVRVTDDAVSRMAVFQTDALPASRYALAYLPAACSPGALFWASNAPGMALFVCQGQGDSHGEKPITGAASSDGIVLTVPGHGYASGNAVKVAGTGMGIDSTWRITVIDENTFALDGSRAAGSFNGSGSVRRIDSWTQAPHRSGTELPEGCSVDEWFFRTDISPNTEALYWCTAPGEWTRFRSINTSDARNFAAIQFATDARRYRFIGIEVTHNPVPNPPPAAWSERDYNQAMFGSLVYTKASNSHIIFDRCDIHGLDYPARLAHGIDLEGSHVALIHSRVHKITRWQERADGGNLESIAINIGDGPGPGKIENNLLEAIGITVFFPDGGYTEIPAADYEFRKNWFHHPDRYLFGSWENVSGKNYKNRHLFELKRGRRMVLEGNTFDGNWADGNQGAMIMLSPRPGSSSSRTITHIENGTFTVSSGSEVFQPGNIVYISGSGDANHDGLWKIERAIDSRTYTLESPPAGSGSTGKVVAVASDIQISDIDVRHNVFRNGPNLLWILGHQDSGGSGGFLNTKTTQRIRLFNNLIYGMDARAADNGGRISPIGLSRNGRSGIAVWASGGMEDLIIRKNTMFDFKGILPSLMAFDSAANGAHAGLEIRDNIFTAVSPVIAQMSGKGFGVEALDRQWTAHPEPRWTVRNNVFCCEPRNGSQRMPDKNVWFDSDSAIGFQDIIGRNFRLLDISPVKAGRKCFDDSEDCTTSGSDAGVDMDMLEAALN
jgi:hypothetical protein